MKNKYSWLKLGCILLFACLAINLIVIVKNKIGKTYSYLNDKGKTMAVVITSGPNLNVYQTIDGNTSQCTNDGIDLVTNSFATDKYYYYDVFLKNDDDPVEVADPGFYIRWRFFATIDGEEYNINYYCDSDDENVWFYEGYFYLIDSAKMLITLDSGDSVDLFNLINFFGTYVETTGSYGSILDEKFSGTDFDLRIEIECSLTEFVEYDFSPFEYQYTSNNTKITITKFDGSSTDVKIPSTIKGVPVTAVNSTTFSDMKTTLKSVEIPATVTSLGTFQNYTALESVTFEEGSQLTSLPSYAFDGCSSLTSIDIPASVRTMNTYAFRNCSNLETVTFEEGSQLTSLPSYAFSGCSSLTSINIPSGVTSIGQTAFAYCSSLTSIEIPAGVTSIGNSAFASCSSLTSIELPSGLTSIASNAFSGCSALTSINIPSGVTSISNCAFERCSSLTSIEIPAGVTSIGYSTFQGCKALTSIEIPAGVTVINSQTFSGCSSLTSIEIPAGVTSIGYSTFQGCKALTSIEIPAGVTSIGYYAFQNCSSLTSMNIPSGVTSIGFYAFASCSSLTSINIPVGVTSIAVGTFMYCSSLTSINIPSGVTSIGSNAFNYCSKLTIVIIDSPSIFNATSLATDNGSLLKYATTVKVLKSIVDNTSNSSAYLTETNFNISTEGDYYVYTKK